MEVKEGDERSSFGGQSKWSILKKDTVMALRKGTGRREGTRLSASAAGYSSGGETWAVQE